jgi:hypothetical protein
MLVACVFLTFMGIASAQKVVSPPQIAPSPAPSQPPSPSGGVSEGSKKQTAPENSPQSTDQDKRGTESSPLAIKLLNTGKSEPEAAQEAQRIKEQAARERWATNWTIGLTAALVFAAFLQFSGLVGQIIVYRKQAGIMQKALSATTKTAEAAEKSATATVAQMRAYVSVVSAKIYGFDRDRESRVLIRIGNTGDTVAFDVTGESGVTIQNAEIFTFKGDLRPKDHGPIFRSRTGMGPKTTFDSFNVIPTLTLTPDIKAAIRSGTLGIFAYGEIRYKDALKNPRHTTYRLMYGGAAGADPEGLFVTCEEGNDSD